jgi:hypothetical protein
MDKVTEQNVRNGHKDSMGMGGESFGKVGSLKKAQGVGVVAMMRFNSA